VARDIVGLSNIVDVVTGIIFFGKIVEGGCAVVQTRLGLDLKQEIPNLVAVLAAKVDGKASVVILLDEAVAVAKGLDAPGIIKKYVAPLIKGGGGGQKTLATAGGQEAGNLSAVIEQVKQLL
jgi:alanyl-tRNA synthetase